MNKNFITAMLVGIEGILFFAFLMPQYRTLIGARQSLEERGTLLYDTKGAYDNIIALANQYVGQEATISRILMALPKQKQYDYLTESFRVAAESTGMELSNLNFKSEQKKTGSFSAVSINAELEGSYPNLLFFLDSLEHSLRLYDITGIEITKSNSPQSSDLLNISLEAKAYSLQ